VKYSPLCEKRGDRRIGEREGACGRGHLIN
jgi:hypothetical protein